MEKSSRIWEYAPRQSTPPDQEMVMSVDLEQFFSACRLSSYRLPGEALPVVLARYQWNLQLAEAMLPSLNYLEVGLRNAVNRVTAGLYGADWLLAPPPQLHFSPEDLRQIEGIRTDILKRKGKPASHDDVLAQLNFGFWVAMFHKRHMGSVWSRGKDSLGKVFPNMPADQWAGFVLNERLAQVKTLLDKVKVLRNRMAHHEPIWKQTPSADVVHQDCIALVRAMSLAAAAELEEIDRFAEVYAAGPKGNN